MPFCLPKVQAVKSDYDSPSLLLDWD